jgi:hypothetical protein
VRPRLPAKVDDHGVNALRYGIETTQASGGRD